MHIQQLSDFLIGAFNPFPSREGKREEVERKRNERGLPSDKYAKANYILSAKREERV